MTSLRPMIVQASKQYRIGHQIADHAKPAFRLRRPAAADRAGRLDSAICHDRLLRLDLEINSPTLPAPASASARLQSSPTPSVGDVADASISSQAKATRGKAGMAGGEPTVRGSTAGTGLRVGEASADLPTTSEFMDVTGGESAPTNSNSGDGLGIHEPGSIGQGRARDRAKCPAVAGSSSLNPTLHSRASVKLAASAVLRGAAFFSFVPAEGIPFAERWRRIPERSPAASAGSRTNASVFIPFKAIDHRTISRDPAPLGSQAAVAPSLSSPTMSVTAADRARSDIAAPHSAQRVVVLHPLAKDRSFNQRAGRECNSQRSDGNKHLDHFKYSDLSMVGVNTA